MIRDKIHDAVSNAGMKGLMILLSLLPVISVAQYSPNSLYSIYGLGEINTSSGTGKVSGMGNAGIALRSGTCLNNLNPASYSKFDSTSFIFDFGLGGYHSAFRSQSEQKYASDINFNHLAIGFPVTKWWGGSAGLLPFSTVGYNISTAIPVEGKLFDIETQFVGKGGINQFYFSNSFSITRQFALGLNLSYLMGYITQNEINKLETLGIDNIYTSRIRHFNNLFYSFGFHYSLNLNNDKLSIGATYNPLQRLNTKYSIEIMVEDADTLKSKSEIQDDFIIPVSMAGGVAYEINSILSFAFDYSVQNWSDAGYSKDVARLVDSYSFKFGMEFRPEYQSKSNLWNRMQYRLGGYYEKTYLRLRNNDIIDRGITFGLGFPIGRQRSTINLSMVLGQMGTLNDGLIRETYGNFIISFTFHDYWFMKRKFD